MGDDGRCLPLFSSGSSRLDWQSITRVADTGSIY